MKLVAIFTLIDNETMAYYLNNPITPAADIIELFIIPFIINPEFQHFRDLIKGVNIKEWWDLTLKNFLLGYLESYKPAEHKQVLQEIKNMFATFRIPWTQFKRKKLQHIKKRND